MGSYVFERKKVIKLNDKKEGYKLADIWDRLAAFVVDLIIIFILSNLISSPHRKKLQASHLIDNESAVLYHTLAIVAVFFITFILYHSFLNYFFGQTIGKRAFKIKIKNIFSHAKPTLWSFILRSVYQFFSMIIGFLPYLEVFSNTLRRPIYDRMSDTIVEGVYKVMPSPNHVEFLWVRLVFIVFLTNVTLFLGAFFYFGESQYSFFSEILVPSEYLCEEVTEAREEWEDTESLSSRIGIALTLYSADMIEKDCLEMEAQKAIGFDEFLDKAYLAKAFVYEDQYELSNEYLKKVCEINSEGEACIVSQVIDAWNEREWNLATQLFKLSKFKKSFSQIWAIKHFDKTQEYDEVLRIVSEMFPNKLLSSFLSEYKTLALKSLNNGEQAEPLFETVYENLEDSDRASFTIQSCYRDLENSCSQMNKSCKLMLEDEGVPYQLEGDESFVFAYLKASRCGHVDLDEAVADLRNRVEDPKIQLFMAAQKAESLNKIQISQQIYRSILNNTEDSAALSYEVRLRLLDIALTDQDYEEQIVWWSQGQQKNPYYRSFGIKLLTKITEAQKWSMAEKVASQVSKFQNLAKDVKQALVVVYFENKNFDLAKKYLSDLNPSSRQIASNSKLNIIQKKLESILKSRELLSEEK